jgi:hypothetical protein
MHLKGKEQLNIKEEAETLILILDRSMTVVTEIDLLDDDTDNYTDNTNYTTMKEEKETTCGKEIKLFEEYINLFNRFYTSKQIKDDIYVLVVKVFKLSPFSTKSFLMTVLECRLA